MSDENSDTFLFTSESVGEGHPGKLQLQDFTETFIETHLFFKSPRAFDVADPLTAEVHLVNLERKCALSP